MRRRDFLVLSPLLCSLLLVLSHPHVASSQEAAPAWKAHPPEYYRAIREETARRISEQRERADLRALGWETSVRETAKTIAVERETWTLIFDRETACPIRAIVRGRDLHDGLALAHLVIIDGQGRKFLQSLSTDGVLHVREEKFHVYLDGEFTPRAADGAPYPVRFGVSYDIYKSCGLVVVRVRALRGRGEATEVMAENTLGRTPEPLRYLQFSNNVVPEGFLQGQLCDLEVTDYRDRVIFQAKLGAAVWSDGAIGLEAMPVEETYLNSPPEGGWPATPIQQPGRAPRGGTIGPDDPRYSPDRYLGVAIWDGASHLDFTLLKRDPPVTLEAGYETAYSFSLLPFRKLRPRPVLSTAPLWGPQGRSTDVEADLRRDVALGANLLAHYLTHNASGPDGMLMADDEATRWGREATQVAKRFNLLTQNAFILWIGLSESQMLREPLLTPEELATLRDVAHTPADQDQIPCSTESPEYRDYVLGGMTIAVKEQGVDGVYFDMAYVYGPLPGLPSEIEGNVRLLEDVRMLLDSFGGGSVITYHSGGQVTPAESLLDYMLPGEPIAGAGELQLTPGQAAIAYNSLLVGSNINLYLLEGSYQADKPEVWKQFLADGACGASMLYTGQAKDWPPMRPQTWANLRRFLHPFFIFGAEKSEVHSYRDGDFSRFARVSHKRCAVNLYVREGETLATASLPPGEKGRVELRFHLHPLGLRADDILVFDTTHDRAEVVKANSGWITVGPLDLSKEPVVLYLRALEDPSTPLIFWHDINTEVLSQKPSQDPITPSGFRYMPVTARTKVVPEEGMLGSLWLYTGDWGPVFCTSTWAPGGPARVRDYDPKSRVALLETYTQPLSILRDRRISSDYTFGINFKQTVVPGTR